ncbi:MAG: outer membrane protein assembly factor BamE [Betaproteobacteria bacterium]|nr:outer membrane protein assembly factor BamE [Betaproteobacteria bacterium]
MRRLLRAHGLALCLWLAACSKVTEENFAKVQNGMSEQEVAAILGAPTESTSREILGISGTTSVWRSGDAEITVRFVGGKVALKSFDKPAPAPK